MGRGKQYKVEDIFEQAKQAIVNKKLIFVEDVVAMLPITKPTFYKYFPVDSEQYVELNELLEQNRVNLKVSMRSKWYKSAAPALQLALMKLLATPEELKKLSMNHHDIDHKNNGGSFEPVRTTIVFKKKT